MGHPLWLIYSTAVVVSLLHVSCQYQQQIHQQQTFYIKPANSSQCPANVSSFYCKDLPTFVLHSHQLLSINTSLLFLSGRHLLTSTLQIANIKEFTMSPYYYSDSDRTSNGISIQITCSGHVSPSVQVENVSFVRMDSITLYQCGSLLLRTISYSSITDGIWNRSTDSSIIIHNSSSIITNCQISDALCNESGCGIRAEQSNITLIGECEIRHNKIMNNYFGRGTSGGLYLFKSHLYLNGSVRATKNKAVWSGGGMVMVYGSLSSTNDSSLVITENTLDADNIYKFGGGLCLYGVNVRFAGSMIFVNNDGGGMYVNNCTCLITGYVLFYNNTGSLSGGGLSIVSGSVVMTNVNFTQNSAKNFGGALSVYKANFTVLRGATFINNVADIETWWHIFDNSGGAISAYHDCIITFSGNVIFFNNTAIDYGGAIHTDDRVITTFFNKVRFTHNSAREGGAVYLGLSSIFVFESNTKFTNNEALYAGGSVSINSQSNVTFLSVLNITGSRADWAGGGIALTDAKMVIDGKAFIEDNEAGSFGGAVFADNSDILLSGSCLVSDNEAQYGGAIHAVDSSLHFSGSHSFQYNLGQFGGGWSLVGSTSLTCSSNSSMSFMSNHARQFGGAIWIEDIYKCVKYGKYTVRKCFFKEKVKIFDNGPLRDEVKCTINHRNNTAILAGSLVYGGNVDNCIFDSDYQEWFPAGSFRNQIESGQVFDTIFHSVKESTTSSSVSSDPTRVCFCRQDNEPNCSLLHVSINVFSGEQFGLSLVGVGQRNGTVPAVILAQSDSHQNLSVQTAEGKCSMVYYTLSTAAPLVRLMIYPESTCNYHFNLNVSAYIKPCPPGFGRYNDTESYACTCEVVMKDLKVQCDITSQSFAHEHGVWISFIQSQANSSEYSESSVFILYHSNCPLDYCSGKNVNFTHNTTDKQCRHNRQGLLCGACKADYSLTLGGSKCAQCSYLYLLLFLVFAVAGVALVVFLLMVGFTVSAGTLNGLIFFANIIGTNSTIFIPPEGASFLRVFIAWLNLDFGIHTCLFPGLDMYTKVWLQFAFPLYVWVLIGVIIVASHHSVLVTRWLGGDPVSVLATLILISYTKLLRTILTALSFTYLQVSDGSRFAVWLYDGNVRYLSGKHIPLFLFALLLFFLLFIPYISVLLVSPYLQPYSKNKFLSWVDDRRLKHFLRSYYAPLKGKCRSWIGLLLAVRFFLLFIFLANSLGDPSINLVAISITMSLIVAFKTLCGTVYTNWCLDALDLLFEIKLILFSVLTLYITNKKGNQSVLSDTFLSVSFLVFSGIILYHVQRRVVGSRWWKYSLKPICKKYFSRYVADRLTTEGELAGEQCQGQSIHRLTEVPITFIELREPLLDTAYT